MKLDIIKTILECITSVCFLLGVWKGILFFGYKNDEGIRKLYIENSLKLKEVYSFFIKEGRIDNSNLNKLSEILMEAELYLHDDIVKHIEDFRLLGIKLICLNKKLDGLFDSKEREKICNEIYEITVKMYKYTEEYRYLYRKQIIQDSFKMRLLNSFKNFFKKVFNKNTLRFKNAK